MYDILYTVSVGFKLIGDRGMMEIRELRTDDYTTVYGFIVNEMEHDEVSFEDMSASLDFMRDDSSYMLYVAENNNKVVGFVSAVKMFGCVDGNYIEITCLAVSKDYQGKGIGKLLLEHIESLGRKNKIKTFSVTSGKKRVEAHTFYENNGYERGGFVFYKGAVILEDNV